MQILKKKVIPHVQFCKMFRFPDIQSPNDLQSIRGLCQYGFENRDSTYLCVNPYHYELQANTMPYFYQHDASVDPYRWEGPVTMEDLEPVWNGRYCNGNCAVCQTGRDCCSPPQSGNICELLAPAPNTGQNVVLVSGDYVKHPIVCPGMLTEDVTINIDEKISSDEFET